MSELEQNKEDSQYKFEEYLVGCDEAIEKYMTFPNGVYYKLAHNPIIVFRSPKQPKTTRNNQT